MQLTFATLNLRGLRSRQKQMQLRRLLTGKRFDFVAVQETKLESDDETERALRLFQHDYNICVSHSVGLSAGCLLLLKNNLPYSAFSYEVDTEGRFICCDFVLHGVAWRLVNIYAFNDIGRQAAFFESMAPLLDCDRETVLMGDFNCVCDDNDRVGQSSRRDKSGEVLAEITEIAGLVDIGASHRGSCSYTHIQGLSHARRDRISISSTILSRGWSCVTEPVSFSDHCIVIAQLGKNSNVKFRPRWALWRFNSTLLSDKAFTTEVCKTMTTCSNADLPLFAAWELFKQEVRALAIELSSVKSFYKKNEEKMLENSLRSLYEIECEAPGSCVEEIASIKCEIQHFNAERYRGARIRSRNNRALTSEKPTHQALLDERRNAMSKMIWEIYSNGTLVTNPDDIMAEFENNYRTLFSASTSAQNVQLLDQFVSLIKPLTDEDCSLVSGPVTQKELELAIDQLPLSKTPGPDGISGEFYKAFKGRLCPILMRIFSEALESEAFPQSFTKSHTILIPKSADKEKLRHADGYRPITLCNVDYKIFAKILANRLQFVMSIVVGPHQTCGLKGRSTQTNIHIARTILDFCSNVFDQLALLQVDLAKAFDRVSHSFLFSLLQQANVGSTLLKGVKLCYNNCTTRLIVNGHLSQPISISSSVKQGCPMSPLLFSLYLEPMCLHIIQSHNIHGFRLLENEVKVLAYADDIAFFCTDKPSIERIVDAVEQFGSVSGAQVNYSKSSGLWFGSWGSTPDQFPGIEWSVVPPKYLGVPLSAHKSSAQYWKDRVAGLERHAKSFIPHNLSIFGKAETCNKFLATKLFYVLQVLHCARVHIQSFHRKFATFIWSSTYESMRRDNLFRPVSAGGLGLVHLYVWQIVSRYFFFRDASHPIIRAFLQVNLVNVLPTLVVSSDSSPRPCLWGFMREVYFSVPFLTVRFSNEYLYCVSRRNLYRDLIAMLFPPPLYRAKYLGLPGHDVLDRVRKMPLTPSTKTFFFKLHSETFRVKTWLRSRDIFVSSVDCPLCDVPETIEHCFNRLQRCNLILGCAPTNSSKRLCAKFPFRAISLASEL